MEENISKTLSYVFAVLFFIAAISVFFVMYNGSLDTMGLVKKAVSGSGPVYETKPEKSSCFVTGAEVLGLIKSGDETTIRIDNVSVLSKTDRETFNFSLIDVDALYSVEYIFQNTGEIQSVIYQKK